jgi:hypothetical protein
VALELKPFEIGIWHQIKNGKKIVSVCKKKKKLQPHEIPKRVSSRLDTDSMLTSLLNSAERESESEGNATKKS